MRMITSAPRWGCPSQLCFRRRVSGQPLHAEVATKFHCRAMDPQGSSPSSALRWAGSNAVQLTIALLALCWPEATSPARKATYSHKASKVSRVGQRSHSTRRSKCMEANRSPSRLSTIDSTECLYLGVDKSPMIVHIHTHNLINI